MASSQVEIASSSPFGCVLRDHNRRDGCRESSTFQKRLKNLVRDHLHTRISIPSDENSRLPNNEERKIYQSKNGNSNYNERDDFPASRWRPLSAKRAKEMATTTTAAAIERKSREGELSALSNNSNTPRTLPRSDSLAEIQNLGASSLVQIWEKRLNSNSTASRSDSGLSSNGNASSVVEEEEEAPRGYEAGDSVHDERFDSGPANEDSFADWQSDKTVSSGQPSPARSRNSDAGESERVRVADIIKRLTAANQGQSPSSSSASNDNDREQSSSPSRDFERALASDQMLEHRTFSPRIRGRQAYADLLMQMERDRHGELNRLIERKAVSRFPQRGRIQSMLRLRLLKRGVAVQDQQRLQSALSQVDRLPQGSSIMHLRERFSSGVELSTTVQNDAVNPRSPHSEITINNSQMDNSSNLNKRDEHAHSLEVNFTEQESPTPVPLELTVEDLSEEPDPSSSVTWQETSSENRNLDSQETADANTCFDDWEGNDIAEELEDNYFQYAETSYDWITDISRPRSYWEDRRQEWYQEMLNSNSENVEIRQLLERGTVSGFLASDFREKMDRLMVTRLERQTRPAASLGGGGEEEKDDRSQLMSCIQNCQQQQREEEESEDEETEGEELEDEEAEGEQEESLISGQYHEASDYFDQSTSSQQIPSPSLLRSWSFRDNEVGEDSDRAASTSPRQDFPSQSYYHSARQCSSSRNHPSVEMEFICELRGQMEQLRQEMSELRRSLKSCMDMQMMLMRQSMKHEAQSAAGGEGKRMSNDGAVSPKKGNCRICYEMKVDSLLYSCGHMCTCLKCAHELQWSSGKCPICRAPIVDVVRAYLDS
ncbi:43kDa postsynaptic protein [Trema orientale]|uniref:43kDa postsynaptic protein n=1 Tax=Trema orientale TaxID=63057 RepID=A0A2P5EDF4_TREOI|nr:43kDa postsynaptic protein [Trema orientale]